MTTRKKYCISAKLRSLRSLRPLPLPAPGVEMFATMQYCFRVVHNS